jgi:ABC-type molybdate transport system substrate-binding protein
VSRPVIEPAESCGIVHDRYASKSSATGGCDDNKAYLPCAARRRRTGVDWGVQPASAQSKDVVVFAAASLQNALDEIARQWHRETGKKAVISYAASNTLIKQIEQGAHADIFFSADLDWMDYGQQKDLIKPDTRFNLLENRLVLIAPRDSSVNVNIQPGFDLAALLKGGLLAMGNVDAVPRANMAKPRSRSSASGTASRTRLRRRNPSARPCC